MFLIERLPSEGKQVTTAVPSANKKCLLKQDISNKISEELKSIWIPPCCKPNANKIGDYCTTGNNLYNYLVNYEVSFNVVVNKATDIQVKLA